MDKITYKFVEGHDGNRLRVAVTGEGPLVLMVHGWPDAWISWRPQMKAVADAGFMAAALDVRGYGESDAPHEVSAYTMTALTGDNAAVIKTLSKDGEAVLIGHDWGAPIVYATAYMRPAVVRAVVGLSSPPAPYPQKKPSAAYAELYPEKLFYQQYFTRSEGVAEAEFEADLERFVRIMHFNLSGDTTNADPVEALVRPAGSTTLLGGLPDPDPLPVWLTVEDIKEYADLFRKNGMRGPLNRYRAQDIDWDEMRQYKDLKIEQPAIFIGGTREPSRHMQGFDRYADPVQRYADCRGVYFIEGAGHWLQREAPEQLNKYIVDFLKSL
jgi:pimeloyl-ACP methyl ester carboxylesterase